MSDTIYISPSGLSMFAGHDPCRRCFWFDRVGNKKDRRPRGIFPSLPSGMDAKLKDWADVRRPDLPPQLRKDLAGWEMFNDLKLLVPWRKHWATGPTTTMHGITLRGAIDDLVIRKSDGAVAILDWKTRGFPVKPGAPDYYRSQMEAYGLMLRHHLPLVAETAFIVSIYPEAAGDSGKDRIEFDFNFHVEEESLDFKEADKRVAAAAKCLRLKSPPPASEKCEYCNYVKARAHEYLPAPPVTTKLEA